MQCIEEFDKPYLIGAHISEGTKLPSGEKISEIINKINHKKLLGIILSCISPENYELNLNEIKNLGVPFGFKLNAFIKTNPKPNYTGAYKKSKTGNPNEFLGVREDLTPERMAIFAKKFKDAGATILGGCCETRPAHIKEMAKLI
jgi:homocysteine S-methyltransferase